MARNAIRDQGREEDDDGDSDSIVQARRRGIPSMRISNGNGPESALVQEEDASESFEIYMTTLAGEDDQEGGETAAALRTRRIPKPRRYTRPYSPRRRNQDTRLQI